jgi:regulator of sigma D
MTPLNDDAKKGFIYGFIVSMMHEVSEKGLEKMRVVTAGRQGLTEALTHFGMTYTEAEYRQFLEFDKTLSDFGLALEKGA